MITSLQTRRANVSPLSRFPVEEVKTHFPGSDPKVAVACSVISVLDVDTRVLFLQCVLGSVRTAMSGSFPYLWQSLTFVSSRLSAFPLPDAIVPGLRIKDDPVPHLLQNSAFCHLNSLSWFSRHSKFWSLTNFPFLLSHGLAPTPPFTGRSLQMMLLVPKANLCIWRLGHHILIWPLFIRSE